MPADLDLIRHLEALADRAWPPAEVQAHDGWELRATGPGIGRRVNSVAPLDDGALPLEEKVLAAESFYRARGLAPNFKLTLAARPEGLDAFLADRGYQVDAPVLILTRRLEPAEGEGPALPATPSPAWLAANAFVPSHYGAAPAAFLDLLGRIGPPRGFTAVEQDGETAAIGMAVADGAWVGLFEIGTLRARRRRGLATAVVERLLAWGGQQGARAAYLQVMEANAPARSLYARFGFTEAYRYWYRVGD
jgi:GNAT superfamily N-acetyltransferase